LWVFNNEGQLLRFKIKCSTYVPVSKMINGGMQKQANRVVLSYQRRSASSIISVYLSIRGCRNKFGMTDPDQIDNKKARSNCRRLCT
jgi:hypothetical protein